MVAFLENLPWWVDVIPWCALVLIFGVWWLLEENDDEDDDEL